MKKNDEKVKPGWYIPPSVRNSFTEFCNLKGTLIQEDFAGALTVWQYLPAEIRELAKLEAKELRAPNLQFWSDFEAALHESPHSLRIQNAILLFKEIIANTGPSDISKLFSSEDQQLLRRLVTMLSAPPVPKKPTMGRRIGQMKPFGR